MCLSTVYKNRLTPETVMMRNVMKIECRDGMVDPHRPDGTPDGRGGYAGNGESGRRRCRCEREHSRMIFLPDGAAVRENFRISRRLLEKLLQRGDGF